jgi:TonB family protein
MSPVPRPVPGERVGFLEGCLVDGDAEQRIGGRQVRRRALGISVAVQSALLATLILVPLFGKPARIALAGVMPLPPYRPSGGATRPNTAPDLRQRIHRIGFCVICPAPRAPARTARVNDEPPQDPFRASMATGPDTEPACPGCVGIDRTAEHRPPKPPAERPTTHERVRRTHLDPAMLIHRVEPVFPTLPRQLGRSGRVELRAIIATDGSIQSLEVVGGDPLFYQSARDAVRQWRYSPTVLNGQPVEIDTYISVIYSMER